MSAVLVDQQPTAPRIRSLSDSRPPGQTWAPTRAELSRQPALSFDEVSLDETALLRSGPAGPGLAGSGPPRPYGHRVHVVPPVLGPPSALRPDPGGWGASLALAFAEALQGRRPLGQLSRWVDEHVLATLTVHARGRSAAPRRAAGGTRQRAAPSGPAVLRSVRLQFPQPEAVELSAHLHVDGRSVAFAFRLEGWGERWLCTALELGPGDGRG
jgi:hypothetical protein